MKNGTLLQSGKHQFDIIKKKIQSLRKKLKDNSKLKIGCRGQEAKAKSSEYSPDDT